MLKVIPEGLQVGLLSVMRVVECNICKIKQKRSVVSDSETGNNVVIVSYSALDTKLLSFGGLSCP